MGRDKLQVVYVGIDLVGGKCCVTTCKSILGRFFGVSGMTVGRWLSGRVYLNDGRREIWVESLYRRGDG